jgi:hypothetical protein
MCCKKTVGGWSQTAYAVLASVVCFWPGFEMWCCIDCGFCCWSSVWSFIILTEFMMLFFLLSFMLERCVLVSIVDMFSIQYWIVQSPNFPVYTVHGALCPVFRVGGEKLGTVSSCSSAFSLSPSFVLRVRPAGSHAGCGRQCGLSLGATCSACPLRGGPNLFRASGHHVKKC